MFFSKTNSSQLLEPNIKDEYLGACLECQQKGYESSECQSEWYRPRKRKNWIIKELIKKHFQHRRDYNKRKRKNNEKEMVRYYL